MSEENKDKAEMLKELQTMQPYFAARDAVELLDQMQEIREATAALADTQRRMAETLTTLTSKIVEVFERQKEERDRESDWWKRGADEES